MNNPRAFPLHVPWMESETQQGMSLRDYFAARALPYCQLTGFQGVTEEEKIQWKADAAYQYADAMLRARRRDFFGLPDDAPKGKSE